MVARISKYGAGMRGRIEIIGLGLAALSLSGCFQEKYDGAFPEGDDVRLSVPGQQGFRSAGETGEVYQLVADTATEVNGWVTEVVNGTGTVVKALSNHPASSKDGDWLIYGPFDDDKGRDLSWLIRIQGNDTYTDYEVFVGTRGAKKAGRMDLFMSGGIDIDGDMRTGTFTLDFAAVERHPQVKDFEDAGKTYSGSIEVAFERNVATEKKIVDIEFKDFRVADTFGDAWFSNETYEFRREDSGSGSFHLAINGQVDDNAFVGRQVNRVELDALWTKNEDGRARAKVLEVDNEASALPHGDLVVHECFDPGGALHFRHATDDYARDEYAGYNFGKESDCLFTEEQIDKI